MLLCVCVCAHAGGQERDLLAILTPTFDFKKYTPTHAQRETR